MSNLEQIVKILQEANQELKEDNDKAEGKVIIGGKEVDVGSIEIDGIDRSDYPDFADAYVDSASFVDGSELSESQLESLQDLYNDVVYEIIIDTVY
jgi:hypothetical protein